MEEVNEFDKRVYNLYLSSTRKYKNKPFKYRKNFDGFEKDPLFFYIKRLSMQFKKYPHMMCEDYFIAPYEISENKQYFDLKFYASIRGISAYTQYKKLKESRDPDNQMEYLSESLKFITNFCIKNKIALKDYAYFKSSGNYSQNDFLKHIKEHFVSPYVAFAIPAMYSVLTTIDDDIFNLYFGNMDLDDLQKRFLKSKSARTFCSNCVEKIRKKLDEIIA